MSHTPGPWTHDGQGMVYASPPDDESTDATFICDCEAGSNDGPAGDPVANGNLIASAPDLLAALKEIQSVLPTIVAHHPWQRTVDRDYMPKINAAIAKAQGR